MISFRLFTLDCTIPCWQRLASFPGLPMHPPLIQLYTPFTGKPRVDSLTFRLDSISTDSFRSGTPVFTLTCNSSGGPATTVWWKRGGREVHVDSSHVITSSLVDQSGPDYTSTLRVRGRRVGVYSCDVRNSKGKSSARILKVTGTYAEVPCMVL